MDGALRGRVLTIAQAQPTQLTLTAADGREINRFEPGSNGSFFLLRLAPGTYLLRAHAGGQEALMHLSIEPGEITDVTLTLDPRATVSLQGSPSDATQSRPGAPDAGVLAQAFVAGDELTLLPVSSRSFEGLAELEPLSHTAPPAASDEAGTGDDEASGQADALVTSDDGRAASGLSDAGLPITQQSASIDGLSAMQYYRAGPRGAAAGGAGSSTSFAQGAVGRFSVNPHSYSAESRSGGAAWSAITSRRAGAALHGSGFAMLRDGAWSATNPFSLVTHYDNGVVSNSLARPGGGVGLLGASAGSPVSFARRPRSAASAQSLWLFGSVEAQWSRDHLNASPELASFYQLTPTQSTLLAVRGVSSTQVTQALNYLDSLTGVLDRSALRVNAFGRVDARLGARDVLALTYAAHRLNAPAGAALSQSSDAVVARGLGSVGDRMVRVDAVAAHWVHRVWRGLDNEAAAQLSHELNQETPRAPLAQEPAIGPGGYAPEINIGPNGFAYGTPATLGRSAYPEETRIEATDTLAWRLRLHLIRMGGAWSRIEDRTDTLTNAEGTFSYNTPVASGYAGGLVDWITDFTWNVHAYPNGGCPSIYASTHDFCFHTFTQSFGPQQLDFVVHQVAAFAQDAWRLRDGLQLNFGARYEYTLLPLPVAPNSTLDAAIATLGRNDAGATAAIPEDRNNVGPRVNMVWAPRFGEGRRAWFTAQLNYGVFYGRTPGATVAAALTDTALPSSTERVRIRATTITLCPQVTTLSQGFGFPCDYVTAPPAAVAQTTSALVLGSHFREPAIQRGSLTLEHSFGQHLWLRMGYAMANATQLPTSTDLNIAPSAVTRTFVLQGGDGRIGVQSGETFVVPMYTTRPIAAYGVITALESHANASFHAGTVEAGARAWRGLTAHASFAYSKALDDGPQQGATPRQNAQFDPFQIGYDKGRSSLDLPRRFTGSLEYRSSDEGSPRWQRRALGGWTLAAVAVAGSGAPYSYAIYGGSYLTGGGDSINASGGAVYLPTIGRNTLRLPTRGRVDLRLTRAIRLRRQLLLEGFVQAFNVANSVSVSRVETRAFLVGTPATPGAPTPLVFQDAATVASEGVQTAPFGTPLSSTSGFSRERQVELGVRFQF